MCLLWAVYVPEPVADQFNLIEAGQIRAEVTGENAIDVAAADHLTVRVDICVKTGLLNATAEAVFGIGDGR